MKILYLVFYIFFLLILFFSVSSMTYRYSSLQSFIPHHSYVVSLTTIPSRVKLLSTCISSLQKQTILPTKIYLHVPSHSSKGQYDWPSIHRLIQEFHPILHLNIIDTDYGPITKLLPILSLDIPSDNIVLVDDDVDYSPHIMHRLLQNADLEAIGFAGFSDDLKYIVNVKRPIKVNYLETFHGVLYKRRLFSDTFFTFFNETTRNRPECRFTDDLIIGAYLRNHHHTLWVIETKNAFVKHDAQQTEELRTHNLSTNNKICAAFLQ